MKRDREFKSKLNRSKYCLPIKGGKLINLKTLEIRTRTMTDYFDFELKVTYMEPHATHHPNVDKLINPMFLNNMKLIEYIQRILGLSMTESMNNREFYICHGEGRNGESALMDLVRQVLGPYYETASKDVFIAPARGGGNGQAASHLMALRGKRCVTFSENAEHEKLNTDRIKAIVGNDEMSARELYGTNETFKCFCKMWLLTNVPPIFDTTQQSIIDRISCIPFNARFVDINSEEHPNGIDKFLADTNFIDDFAENHLNEFFTWMCKGAQLYFTDTEGNKKPQCVKAALKKIIDDVDTVQKFLAEYFERGKTDEHFITKDEFYEKYKSFLLSDKIDKNLHLSKKKVSMTMSSKGFIGDNRRIVYGKRKRSYVGIKYNN